MNLWGEGRIALQKELVEELGNSRGREEESWSFENCRIFEVLEKGYGGKLGNVNFTKNEHQEKE